MNIPTNILKLLRAAGIPKVSEIIGKTFLFTYKIGDEPVFVFSKIEGVCITRQTVRILNPFDNNSSRSVRSIQFDGSKNKWTVTTTYIHVLNGIQLGTFEGTLEITD